MTELYKMTALELGAVLGEPYAPQSGPEENEEEPTC